MDNDSPSSGATLYLHGRQLTSIFELLGTKEDDITYSLGWALAQCPALSRALLGLVLPRAKRPRVDRVFLQEREGAAGITDIELRGPSVHVIVEAKRGWVVPSRKQLKLYATRLDQGAGCTALVTMSECSREYASMHAPQAIAGHPIIHVPWRDVQKMCTVSTRKHAERRLLRQLSRYLERVVKMQDQTSNLVYVVSLKPSSIDALEKSNCYWHPVGLHGWPKEPPNYVGFRYRGRLQSMHHVEGWEIVTRLSRKVAGAKRPWRDPHFLYHLGPAIRPPSPVRTGSVFRSGRVWAALDLLLTCETISDARDETKERLAAAEDAFVAGGG